MTQDRSGPAIAAKTKNAAECSQLCRVRKTRFAATPDAKRTAMAADVAGAFTPMLNSSAQSTQNTAAAQTQQKGLLSAV